MTAQRHNEFGYSSMLSESDESSPRVSVLSSRTDSMDNITHAVRDAQVCILERVSRMSLSTPRPTADSSAALTTDDSVESDDNELASIMEGQAQAASVSPNLSPVPSTPLRSRCNSASMPSMPSMFLPSLTPSLVNRQTSFDDEYKILRETICTSNMASSRRQKYNARRIALHRNQRVAKKRMQRTTSMTTMEKTTGTARSVTPLFGEEGNGAASSFLQPSVSTIDKVCGSSQRPAFSTCRTISDDSLGSDNNNDATSTPSQPKKNRALMTPLFAAHRMTSRGGAKSPKPGSIYDERLSNLASNNKKAQQVRAQHDMFATVQPDTEIPQHLMAPSLTTPSFSIGASGCSQKGPTQSPARLLRRQGLNGTSRLPRICYRPKKNWSSAPSSAASRRRAFRVSVQQEERSNLRMRTSSQLAANHVRSAVNSSPSNNIDMSMPVFPHLSPSDETVPPSTPARIPTTARTRQFDDEILSPFEEFARSVENEVVRGGMNSTEESLNLEEMAREGLTMPVF